MRKGYSMNYATNTLTITRGFNRRACDENTEEYRKINQLRGNCPNLRIVFYTPKRKRTSRLTYDKMVCYIGCFDDAAKRLQEFNAVREFSQAQPSPYTYVKSWFVREFPKYKELPQFDKSGNIIHGMAAVEPESFDKVENKSNDVA